MPPAEQYTMLKEFELTPRVADLKEIYSRAVPEVCTERARLVTQFSREHGLFKHRISVLERARLFRHVLEHRKAIVRHTQAYERDDQGGLKPFQIMDRQLFAGSTTQKFKGVPLYPEFLGLALWPELRTLSTRSANPYQITEGQIKEINEHIYPYWLHHHVRERARQYCSPRLMKLHELIVFFLCAKVECISHTVPDFSGAVKHGLFKLIEDARKRRSKTNDRSTHEFYDAVAEVLGGIISYSRRLADEAERLANAESDPRVKAELVEIAKIHRHVPENGARNFREGLTTVWVCWTAFHLENPNIGLSLGRLDQVLNKLYTADIESKFLDVPGALELLCGLWLKICDHVPMVPQAGEQLFGGTGSNHAITIGGVDRKGRSAVNGLTYLILRSIELMELRDPNLNARYHPDVHSDDYLEALCAANVTTRATPAIHSDRAVIQMLQSKKDPAGSACDYSIVGCVEPTSSGSYAMCSSILLNLTSALELALFNGRHRHTHRYIGMHARPISIETGDPGTFSSFPQFKSAVEQQIRWLANQAVDLDRILSRVHQEAMPTPVLSALFAGPMDKGKDLTRGGAEINSSGVTIIGLADVADSLSAIEQVVFNDHYISFAEFLKALQADFRGYDVLYTLLNYPEKTPKYGNGKFPAGKGNAVWLMDLLDRVFGAKTGYWGGNYRVGYWTMTSHAGLGRLMGATPNGRRAGENFASGLTPVSGVTTDVSTVLNIVAGLPSACISNGVPVNLKIRPDRDPDVLTKQLVPYVKSYMNMGGMEIQFNVTGHEVFKEAMDHPDSHRDLLVRVSGYTAFFKDLNPQMQVEIINRAEYELGTGSVCSYPTVPLPQAP